MRPIIGILGSAIVIRVIGSLSAATALVLVAFVLHPDMSYRVALVVFGLVLLVQPLEVVSLFYEARTRSRYVVWVELAASVVYLGAVILFIAMDLDVMWFLQPSWARRSSSREALSSLTLDRGTGRRAGGSRLRLHGSSSARAGRSCSRPSGLRCTCASTR